MQGFPNEEFPCFDFVPLVHETPYLGSNILEKIMNKISRPKAVILCVCVCVSTIHLFHIMHDAWISFKNIAHGQIFPLRFCAKLQILFLLPAVSASA